jgi:hypothetical protein
MGAGLLARLAAVEMVTEMAVGLLGRVTGLVPGLVDRLLLGGLGSALLLRRLLLGAPGCSCLALRRLGWLLLLLLLSPKLARLRSDR